MKKSIRNILAGTVSVVAAAAIITGGTIISSAARAEKNSIGSDAAVSAALRDAGLKREDALRIESDFDRENGKYIFNVKFDADGKEYEYDINAKTGEIIDKDIENDKKTPVTSKASEAESTKASADKDADIEKAKQIALSDAGVSAADAEFIKAKADIDDGIKVFDIEFIAGSKEYEYEINASSGRIIEKDSEAVNANSRAAQKTKAADNSADNKDIDNARQAALSHAGLNSKDVRFTKVKLDKDNGISVYEIEFISGNYEYEYEINAKTGKVIDWDKEIRD